MSNHNKFAHLKALSSTEKILIEILKNQGDISVDTGDIVINTDEIEQLLQGVGGATETFSASRNTNTTGSVAIGAFSVSFTNTGAVNALVAGTTIEPGETWEADAKTGNTLGAIAWDATGATAELVILETR